RRASRFARRPPSARTRPAPGSRRRPASAYPPRRASLRELLHEAQPRAALAGLRGDLELVGDRPDDRDAETAFRELVAVEGRRLVGIEARPVVDDLDAEPVSVQLVGDLDV